MAGPLDIDPAKPHAFLSYTRFDDKVLNGGISALREALELAVQARTGKPFNIFQDVEDISPGDSWQKKLDRAIEAAQLFIPILTPSFFESDFCKGEAEAFLDYEARAGREDLVLPIYLIDTPKLDDADLRITDDLASRLHERQYADWRPLRFRLQHHDTLPRIDELAKAIALAIARNGQAATPPPEPVLPKEVMDRIATLETGLRDERSRRQQAESALAEEEGKARELAEAPSAFEGEVAEAKKREAELRDVIKNLKAELDARDGASAQRQLEAVEAALQEERAKRDKAETGAPRIPRSLYLGGAALALLVGVGGGLMIGQDGSPPPDDRVDELTNQVEMLTARLEESEQVAAAKDRELVEAREALAEAKGDLEDPENPPRAGETFRDCADCPEMVVIPAGSFLMGSPEGQGSYDERAQHDVTIAKPFALGKYEVTFAEWDACVDAGGCDREPDDEGWGRGARPVINVSWEDAQQYVAWLSGETGETYRLPSEAEWEYAARAGTTTPYFWGDEIGQNRANCHGCGSEWDSRQTAPVGSFAPNDFGLNDMSGNVWEWVEDSWHDSYDGAPPDGSAWVVGNESARVLRGGSWVSEPGILRSANRDWFEPDLRLNYLGFRVARTLTP